MAWLLRGLRHWLLLNNRSFNCKSVKIIALEPATHNFIKDHNAFKFLQPSCAAKILAQDTLSPGTPVSYIFAALYQYRLPVGRIPDFFVWRTNSNLEFCITGKKRRTHCPRTLCDCPQPNVSWAFFPWPGLRCSVW